jgi:histone-lysine N-methyltransferase SETMAR
VPQFKRGDFSTCVWPRTGRPKIVTTQDIVEQIHELTLKDRRILNKSIAEQLSILRERVWSIMHEDLNMRKLSADWVPKCLYENKKRTTVPVVRPTSGIISFGAIKIIFFRDW